MAPCWFRIVLTPYYKNMVFQFWKNNSNSLPITCNYLSHCLGTNPNLHTKTLDDVVLHLCKLPTCLLASEISYKSSVSKFETSKLHHSGTELKIGSFNTIKENKQVEIQNGIPDVSDSFLSGSSSRWKSIKHYFSQVNALTIRNLILYRRYPL